MNKQKIFSSIKLVSLVLFVGCNPPNATETKIEIDSLPKKYPEVQVDSSLIIVATNSDTTALDSNSTIDYWNLELPLESDFTLADARRLTKHIYDTVKNEPYTESPDDIMHRTFTNLNFIRTDKGLYAVAICENQGPQYGVYTGWCDAFAFKKEVDGWQLTSVLLQAGGGGRMGFPGQYERMIQIGDVNVGTVISSYIGQSGIEVVRETIVEFEDGNLSPLTTIATDYSRDESFGTAPVRIFNKYRFEGKGKPNYDLLIEQYDDGGKQHKKMKSDRIIYKNGYQIPEDYEFES